MQHDPSNLIPLRPGAPGFARLAPATAGAPQAGTPASTYITRRAIDLVCAIGGAWLRLPLHR